MDFRDRRRYEMLTRVLTFARTHAHLFPPTSSAHEAFATVAAEVEQLGALDIAERAASQSARVQQQRVARTAFRAYLKRAGSTARVLARTIPQLDVSLELPDGADDVLLLTIARQFAAAAAPQATAFAAHGIATEELEQRIAAFEAVLSERGLRRGEQVQARARIQASIERALHAVATLDVTVANQLGTDAAALAVWKRDRKVHYGRRSRTGTSVEPAPAPATPPAAAPATPPAAAESDAAPAAASV